MPGIGRDCSKGFTLVEVIVVSIIVAILAAVAIPIYIGYINDSAQNVANNEATNFATAVSAGINSGATAATLANNVYTWSMPTTFSGTAPTYRIANGISVSNVTNIVNSGGSATISVRGKQATARW